MGWEDCKSQSHIPSMDGAGLMRSLPRLAALAVGEGKEVFFRVVVPERLPGL